MKNILIIALCFCVSGLFAQSIDVEYNNSTYKVTNVTDIQDNMEYRMDLSSSNISANDVRLMADKMDNRVSFMNFDSDGMVLIFRKVGERSEDFAGRTITWKMWLDMMSRRIKYVEVNGVPN